MPEQEGFTRRICAVLLADVSGYSTLVGRDDEQTARAVHRLQEVVYEIVTAAPGQCERRAGDAIFATFDSVVIAVQAALAILRRIKTEELTGTPLQVRIGIHFGDVLLREGAGFNEAVGDAINIAARLQSLARPDTICISDGVYRHVRHRLEETFVDLGRQQLKNISDPIHAYLIVPGESGGAQQPVRRRRVAWGAGVALAVFLAAAALIAYRQLHSPVPSPAVRLDSKVNLEPPRHVSAPKPADQPAEQVALGVMVFKSMGEPDGHDWRREALRDGLNTQLSRLSHVKIYSKEFLDFLVSRKGLSEIEAATQLGIRKMLSGSFAATKGVLQLEIHVVDVETGVMEASYTTSGSADRFAELQNDLTMGVISHLKLPVSDEEKQMLLAQQNPDAEVLKLFLETEGGTARGAPTPGLHEPRSWLPGAIWWLTGTPALADTPPEDAIRDLLEQYRRAMEGREIKALAALYTEFPPDLEAAQQRYFDNVSDLRIAIENFDIVIVADEAVVSYTRTDDFKDVRTGRVMHLAVRVTKILRQTGGTWKLMAK